MEAGSVEPHPAEQLVAPPQGQVAAIWLVKRRTNQQNPRTGWGGGYHGRVSITAGAVARPVS